MNRIDIKFRALRAARQKGFIAYICAGDPNLRATAALARGFERMGVDVLEFGVPFSDPLADGVVNQLAAERALRSGTTLHGVLKMVGALRRGGYKVPIVFYVYYNVVHHYGLKNFVRDAVAAGVDGVLALDLPPEEAGTYEAAMKGAGLHPIYLVAPTTPSARIGKIQPACQRFHLLRVARGRDGDAEETRANRDEACRNHSQTLEVAGRHWVWNFESGAGARGGAGGGRGGGGQRDCEPDRETWNGSATGGQSGPFCRRDGARGKERGKVT